MKETRKHNTRAFQRNILLIAAFQCLVTSLGATVPVIIIIWKERGLSVSSIALLQVIFALALLVLEVPTGYVADLFKRKLTMSIGVFIFAFGSLAYPFCFRFWHFAVIEAVLGLGLALCSGADQAICYDSLATLGRAEDFNRIWGKIKMGELASLAIGNILAVELSQISMSLPFIIVAVAYVIAYAIACQLEEPPRDRIEAKGVADHYWELIQVGQYCFFSNQRLRLIICQSSILFAFCQGALWLYEPFWNACGISAKWFGAIFCSCQLIAAYSAKQAHKIEGKLGFLRLSAYLLIILSASYLLAANIVFVGGFVYSFLHQVVRGISTVVYPSKINSEIAARHRATVASICSMSARTIYTFVLILIWILGDKVGLFYLLDILGILLLGLGLLLFVKRNTASI